MRGLSFLAAALLAGGLLGGTTLWAAHGHGGGGGGHMGGGGFHGGGGHIGGGSIHNGGMHLGGGNFHAPSLHSAPTIRSAPSISSGNFRSIAPSTHSGSIRAGNPNFHIPSSGGASRQGMTLRTNPRPHGGSPIIAGAGNGNSDNTGIRANLGSHHGVSGQGGLSGSGLTLHHSGNHTPSLPGFQGNGATTGWRGHLPMTLHTSAHTSAQQLYNFMGLKGATGGASGQQIRTAAVLGGVTRHTASWQHASTSHLQSLHSNIGSAVRSNGGHGMHNWVQNNLSGHQHFQAWGNNVRSHVHLGNNACFNRGFWSNHHYSGFWLGSGGGWWGYRPYWGVRPWWYWYGSPGWGSCNSWFSGYGWTQPYYYAHGSGGNVVYCNNNVYLNGQLVGSAADYAASAADLATIDPATLKPATDEDWLALGTFSIATSEDDVNPDRVIQLAVNKEGLISGTMYNKKTDKAYTVQGKVDKETQRVAFTIGEDKDIVLECGLYNLTQQETPVLVHFGPDTTANYLFARLPEPPHEGEDTATPPALAPPVADPPVLPPKAGLR